MTTSSSFDRVATAAHELDLFSSNLFMADPVGYMTEVVVPKLHEVRNSLSQLEIKDLQLNDMQLLIENLHQVHCWLSNQYQDFTATQDARQDFSSMSAHFGSKGEGSLARIVTRERVVSMFHSTGILQITKEISRAEYLLGRMRLFLSAMQGLIFKSGSTSYGGAIHLQVEENTRLTSTMIVKDTLESSCKVVNHISTTFGKTHVSKFPLLSFVRCDSGDTFLDSKMLTGVMDLMLVSYRGKSNSAYQGPSPLILSEGNSHHLDLAFPTPLQGLSPERLEQVLQKYARLVNQCLPPTLEIEVSVVSQEEESQAGFLYCIPSKYTTEGYRNMLRPGAGRTRGLIPFMRGSHTTSNIHPYGSEVPSDGSWVTALLKIKPTSVFDQRAPLPGLDKVPAPFANFEAAGNATISDSSYTYTKVPHLALDVLSSIPILKQVFSSFTRRMMNELSRVALAEGQQPSA